MAVIIGPFDEEDVVAELALSISVEEFLGSHVFLAFVEAQALCDRN